jgi:predicted DCC family thiol-disulfide oxidoreductase YuxK
MLPLLTTLPRRLAPQEGRDSEHPIIFFDGVCGLCNGFVDYMMARDRLAVFRFATLQSDTALSHLGGSALAEDSIALVDDTGTYQRSDALLLSVARLGGIHAAAHLLLLVPRSLRNRVYNQVAMRRYRLFGMTDTCRIPSPEERGRFLV